MAALRLPAGMVLTVLALSACSGGGSSEATPPPVDRSPPTVPAGITVAALSPTEIRVSWSASIDAGSAGLAGYRVYRNGAATPVATVAVTVTSYTDSNLAANTNYSYTVSAFDAASPANESALSASVSATTPPMQVIDTTPPTVPANLTVIALSPTEVRLTWTASTDAGSGVAGYRVFRNGGPTAIATVPAGTTYTDSGLTANTAYFYAISAFDAATPGNESALTATENVTTPAVPDITGPTTPAGLTATALSSTQILISWSASTDTESGVGGYRIYRDDSASPLATVSSTTTIYTDSGLTAGTLYSYRVRAFDQATPTANVSALSLAAIATTQAAPDSTAPTVPGNVTATALSTTQIQISWSASTDTESGIGGYRIYRDGSATVLATTTSTNYTDTGLTASTAYSYRVRAFDLATPTANLSALSVAASATTQAPPDTTAPTVPAGVSAIAQSSSQIEISWSASTDSESGVGGYRIYRDGSALPLATVTSTSYTDTGLTAGITYNYRVRAFDLATPTANVSALSVAASATTPALPDITAPTVPAGVTAAAQSSTQILISWSPSTDVGTGVAGYRIYRDGSAAPLATVTTTGYVDTGLSGSTTYSYQVRAYDLALPTANESALSVAVSATTLAAPDTTAPTVPANVTAAALSSTQILISWSASTDTEAGVGGYRIYRDGSVSPLATVTSTSYTDIGLTPTTAYSYRVRAFDLAAPTANVSALSAAASATTPEAPDITAPTVPGNVTATALSTSEIQISWSASADTESGVGGYRIYRDGSASVLATTTSTNYTDTGLTASTAYSYRVRAFDLATPANVSALSAEAFATTQTPPDTTAPTVPGNVTATAQSSTQILISWSASTDTESGVGGYRIYRDGSATVLATTTATNYTDTGLTASTAYSYRVRAFDLATPTANESALSATASATTETPPDTTAPTVPASVTATAQSTSQIQITWSASSDTESGVGGYRIYRDGSATVLATTTSTSYTDTGLTASTAYSYRVRAFDQATPTANESALSAAASATTQAQPDTTAPTVPGTVAATAVSHSEVQVSWSASTDTESGVGGYRIYRDGSASPLATVTTTSYADSGLAASTTYSYQVRAFDQASPTANVSALSAAASATTQAAPPPVSGLDARPSNTTCVAGAPPSQSAAYTYQQVFSGGSLGLDTPVALLQAPGDNSRWFVVQQGGIVKKFNNVASPPAATNFVNLTSKVTYSGERGLLGMAFHPDFPTDPRVYFYYTTNTVDRLSEFRTTDGGLTLDPNSENILFNVTDPEENHNGGGIAFGPDGYLYIGTGDGGGGNDQHGTNGNGQRLTILLGKMLRIDVGPFDVTPQPYTIPAGNPFSGNARCNSNGTGSASCPEIFAYGFRNPWRWSFDRGTGDLWVGDVGESDWEEINLVTVGGNYGWRCREGAHDTGLGCGSTGPFLDPVAEIAHPAAGSITGGFVYRGSAIPGLNGRYVFGDFSAGWLWDISRTTTPTLVLDAGDGVGTPAQMPAFAEDLAGELYFFDYGSANIYKIVPSGGGGGTVASLLSQTGCANSSDPRQPASGMIPYAPNAPFWSDGAIKTRWLALPNDSNIDIDATSHDFDFPAGSVLRKDFTLGSTPVETRLFMRHTGGSWAGYTYQWNAQGTEATRVVSGLTTTVNGQTWEFPSESACMVCHTGAAGRTLGLEVGQLNGDLLYPTTGRTANQLYTLNFIDTLRPLITLPVDQLPAIPNPFGSTGTENDRARAWLHSNCSNCHRPGGGTPVSIDLRYTTSLLGTNSCDVAPTAGDLGISNARLIAPGEAARSVVLARVNRVGTDAMPPLARHAIDTQGVALLTSWINSLTSCN